MLSYDLSDEQRLFRDTVREFAEGEIGPVAEELDREGRFPVDLVRRAAVRVAPASDPAPGSVRPNAPSALPAARSGSHPPRCSSLPNR